MDCVDCVPQVAGEVVVGLPPPAAMAPPALVGGRQDGQGAGDFAAVKGTAVPGGGLAHSSCAERRRSLSMVWLPDSARARTEPPVTRALPPT